MPRLVFGHPFAVLVASVLLSAIAYKHLHKKKARKFDVFLSFCGEDAPKNFINSLYIGLLAAGIGVFKDDDWLHRSQKIGPDLVQAIKNSKILIPILSLKYTSSRWCLDELVQIMECKNDSSEHIVLPIFFRVEQREIDGFGQKVVDEQKRRAVAEISSLKGWESEKVANGDEGQLIELVVRKVLIELKKKLEMVFAENPIGIKRPVKDIMQFLDHHHVSTIYVGIHGEGGVGKTTLAKVIYKKLSDRFDHCSFLADIRESCKCKGIKYLQNHLISDILKTKKQAYDKDEGISLISSQFKGKKVLIFLDDVNANDQLEALAGDRNWFASGSRIIITTRDKSVLDWAKVDYQYEHKEMDEDEAKILFARHAFRRDSPPNEFSNLSDHMVSTIRRYPLILEIMGSYLCGKSLELWENTREKLQKLQKFQESRKSRELHKSQELAQMEMQETLKTVYDALEYEQRKIFLDISCFLVGSDARIASCMWDAHDSYLGLEMEELIFMQLIKIGDNHELRMHDELRDFGRTIVHEEHHDQPDNGSRLWDYKEALKMLEGNEGIENIRALSLDKGISKETIDSDSLDRITYQGSQIYTNEQFKNLLSLRFLHVSDANFMGDFKRIFSKLRWLRWERCPQTLKAENFDVKELAVLDLSRSKIADNWQGWSSIILAEKLKVLNLTGCRSLESTFFLSAFRNLEILIFRNCDKLKRIHPSIGDLETLVSLDLSGCSCLTELPVEVGNLRGLKELLLDQTQIREIPSSICSLKKLEMLSAKKCKLLARLPDSMCNLVNLSTLVLSNCLAPLPDSIGSLVKLRRLSLQSCCQLRLIPDSIVKLESLTELVLTGTSITELPKSIEKLQNLEILNISWTSMKKLPNAIGRLRKLQELDASWCTKLSEVTSSIRDLSSLQRLNLLGCLELHLLPKLPSNLTVVGVTYKSVKLPSFSHLIHLKQLRLHNCKSLKSIPELPSTPLELEVLGCEALQFYPGTGPDRPKNWFGLSY